MRMCECNFWSFEPSASYSRYLPDSKRTNSATMQGYYFLGSARHFPP